MTAKAQREFQDRIKRNGKFMPGDQTQIAVRIGIDVRSDWRDNLITKHQPGQCGFDTSRGSEQMTQCSFHPRRGDGVEAISKDCT